MRPFENPAVAAHFAAYPSGVRRRMMALRELIFRTAAVTERDAALPSDSLTLCIAAALTYHRRRRP